MKIELAARKSLILTLSITGVMCIFNIAVIIAQFFLGLSKDNYFVRELNMEYEKNLPTLWSALLLLYASILLYNLAKQMFKEKDYYKWLWALLSLAFFYLCMDEAFELHEKTMAPTHQILKTSGIFFYAWIIPAGLAVIVMGIVYRKFIFDLPSRSRNLFIISGIIYVGAAIGFEMYQGLIEQGHPDQWMNLPYAISVMIEETLEMLGICLFTYAIIDYSDNRFSLETEEAV